MPLLLRMHLSWEDVSQGIVEAHKEMGSSPPFPSILYCVVDDKLEKKSEYKFITEKWKTEGGEMTPSRKI